MPRRSPSRKSKDITVAQYTKGFEVFESGGSLSEILSATGMSRQQFEYLLDNGLPGQENEHPSYWKRFSEISAALRKNGTEAATIVSKGAVRHLRNRDKLAMMAEVMAHLIFESRTRELHRNAQLDPNSDEWRPMHKLAFTNAENQMLRTLNSYMEYAKLGDVFERVYERAPKTSGAVLKPAKLDVQMDPDASLPASVTSRALLAEAQNQDSEDFHQQLFRNFEDLSEKDLEHYLETGELPETEKRRRNTAPEEM